MKKIITIGLMTMTSASAVALTQKTENLWLNKIRYAIYPIGRLSVGYKLPKAKRVKEIICTLNP